MQTTKKVLLYKSGLYYNYAIYVTLDGEIYKEAVLLGWEQITAEDLRQLDCPCKWNIENEAYSVTQKIA